MVSSPAFSAPPIQQLGEIVVVGVTPLPGLDLPASQVPLNAQSAQADDVAQMHGQSITDLLQQNFQGISITQSQGNPWQGNLYFHGYTLSPLQGSPSGMSVYMDGVRQNEPFAETMNWDAIPDFAIRNVTLIPSSSPLYGLNTLGGALVLDSKSGFTDPGGSFDVSGGSWGRIQADADFGAHNDHFGFYAGVASDYETGWRDYSPSRVQQAFVRFDWRPSDGTAVTLGYTGAHAKLFGTQTIPIEWAATPETAFTWPDFAVDNLGQYTLRGNHQFDDGWSLQASAYLRLSQARSFDSNTNDYDSCDPGSAGDCPDYAANGPFDPDSLGQYYYAGLTPPYDPDNPAATINNVVASNVLGNVRTRGYGGSLQAVYDGNLLGHDNHFTLGVSLDAGNTRFDQFGQPAFFPYVEALRGDTLGLLPFDQDLMTAAATGVRSVGLYFLDAVALTDAVHLTAGGRYDHSSVSVGDLTGAQPDIDGRNHFHRFNPSIGLTWSLSRDLGAYVNYDEGMRTPTPIELECADPDAPCSLPNDFTGDPPLQPVIARTLSGGLRGSFAGGKLHWNLSPYTSRADNDILTIFTGGSSQGYFANVPKTVRKGVDAGLGGQLGKLEWQANYSFVDATYGAPFEEQSGDNSSADDDGVIFVHSGDRIPGIPRQVFTLAGEYHFTPQWSFGGNLRAYSGQYAVGDENNGDDHGKVPGYAVLDLDLHWQATRQLSFFAQVQNAFDRRYFVSGQLSDNVFDTPDRLIDTSGPGTSTLFVAPGAPRGWFVGLSYHFGEEGH
ncbi:MAG: TonB-dependent receptor [Proteobacteria bacterium]|nr:TonB-dependent receptor [Pseudomonadota bacterium]